MHANHSKTIINLQIECSLLSLVLLIVNSHVAHLKTIQSPSLLPIVTHNYYTVHIRHQKKSSCPTIEFRFLSLPLEKISKCIGKLKLYYYLNQFWYSRGCPMSQSLSDFLRILCNFMKTASHFRRLFSRATVLFVSHSPSSVNLLFPSRYASDATLIEMMSFAAFYQQLHKKSQWS